MRMRWFVGMVLLGLVLGACNAPGAGRPLAATLPAAGVPATLAAADVLPATAALSPAAPTATFTPPGWGQAPAAGTTDTPAPATARPTWQMCRNDLALVLNLNQPDQGVLLQPPSADFELRWRVRNTGTCTWDNSYALAPQGDDPLLMAGAAVVPVAGRVKPGEMVDFAVEMLTPLLGGTYQAAWRLQDGSGRAFGETLQTVFQVAAITPDSSASEVRFRASPLEIEPDGRVAFAWDASQAKEAYFYQAGQAWQEHRVPLRGAVYVYPARTGGYLLRVVNADDTVEVQKIVVNLLPPGPPLVIIFVLDPDDFIMPNKCVTIDWDATYHAKSVDLYRDETLILDDAEIYGRLQDCPPGSGVVVRYKLVVSGVGGTTTRVAEIEIK